MFEIVQKGEHLVKQGQKQITCGIKSESLWKSVKDFNLPGKQFSKMWKEETFYLLLVYIFCLYLSKG